MPSFVHWDSEGMAEKITKKQKILQVTLAPLPPAPAPAPAAAATAVTVLLLVLVPQLLLLLLITTVVLTDLGPFFFSHFLRM